MDIKERIRRLQNEKRKPESKVNDVNHELTLEKLRILLREKQENKKSVKNVDEFAHHINAKVIENDFGKFILKEGEKQDSPTINELEKIHILAKEDIFKNFNLTNNLFVDIETSGLSGGVGTFAFLIGLGYLENGIFKIKQFFLPDLPFEKAMLVEIASFMRNFQSITTFNGKSFDLPVLVSRYRLQMLKEPLFNLHLDLLHIARRVYKRTFEDRSLQSLEQHILGQRRMDDIAGNMIPDVYFHFLKTGEVSLLAKVIKHNEIDVISMLKLLAHFTELLKEIDTLKNPEVLFSISKLYLELNDFNTSIFLMKRALKYTENIPLIFEIKKDLSKIYKKLNMWKEAKTLWEELLAETPFEPFPYIELAKYYEHKTKEYSKAKGVIENLKKKLGGGWEYCTFDDIVKRDIRIRNKIKK